MIRKEKDGQRERGPDLQGRLVAHEAVEQM
jgi:hypothetical protein